MNAKQRRVEVLGIVLVASLLGVPSFLMARRMLAPEHHSDYPAHVGFAQALERGDLPVPHVLFHAALIGVRRVLPGEAGALAPAIVTTTSSVALAGLLVVLSRRALRGRSPYVRRVGPPVMALVLLTVSPITIFSWPRQQYLGYIGINVYHNPTVLVLKPLALSSFYVAVAALRGGSRSPPMALVGAAVLAAASVLAKPSYAICLLPALVGWAAARRARSRPVDWPLLGALVVPSFVVLAGVYWASATRVAIVFAPLSVVTHFVEPRTVWWRLVLSVLFPATTYLLYLRAARNRLDFNLAWLVFAVGATLFYFAAETGVRRWHANLAWSAQVSLFVLFVVAALFLVSKGIPARRGWTSPRLLLALAVLALHVVSGIGWYAAQLGGPAPDSW